MSETVKWQDFDKLHVIRRLRQLVGNRWKVQLNFTDEKGFVRGVTKGKFFNPLNEVCIGITNKSHGFKGCMGTVKQTTLNSYSKRNKNAHLSTCHAGFSTLSVPIVIKGVYLGCVFGDGFIISETEKQQKIQLSNYLKANFSTDKELQTFMNELPVLSSTDVEYLTELIKIIVDEMLLTEKNLHDAEEEVKKLKNQLGVRYGFGNMIGKSSAMRNLYALIERVCDSSALILIQGENGSGKELIARALHFNSKRKSEKFIPMNCGAFNENLLESELFGHIKGAFTGAVKDKVGLFEAANNGTIFLDEIGDTAPSMQVKLLRVLQNGSYTPVGATSTKKSNARVVCATNKDLSKMVREGTFREDLFYRLNVINLIVPPLRERKEDIPILIESFIEKYSKSTKMSKKTVNPECMKTLYNYDWPGNVRELENEVERLCVLSGHETEIHQDLLSQRVSRPIRKTKKITEGGHLKQAIEELEKEMIFEGLQRTRWNKSKLAKELGISRASLISKVEKYDLDKRRYQE